MEKGFGNGGSDIGRFSLPEAPTRAADELGQSRCLSTRNKWRKSQRKKLSRYVD
jgi:hypothetical protein